MTSARASTLNASGAPDRSRIRPRSAGSAISLVRCRVDPACRLPACGPCTTISLSVASTSATTSTIRPTRRRRRGSGVRAAGRPRPPGRGAEGELRAAPAGRVRGGAAGISRCPCSSGCCAPTCRRGCRSCPCRSRSPRRSPVVRRVGARAGVGAGVGAGRARSVAVGVAVGVAGRCRAGAASASPSGAGSCRSRRRRRCRCRCRRVGRFGAGPPAGAGRLVRIRLGRVARLARGSVALRGLLGRFGGLRLLGHGRHGRDRRREHRLRRLADGRARRRRGADGRHPAAESGRRGGRRRRDGRGRLTDHGRRPVRRDDQPRRVLGRHHSELRGPLRQRRRRLQGGDVAVQPLAALAEVAGLGAGVLEPVGVGGRRRRQPQGRDQPDPEQHHDREHELRTPGRDGPGGGPRRRPGRAADGVGRRRAASPSGSPSGASPSGWRSAVRRGRYGCRPPRPLNTGALIARPPGEVRPGDRAGPVRSSDGTRSLAPVRFARPAALAARALRASAVTSIRSHARSCALPQDGARRP